MLRFRKPLLICVAFLALVCLSCSVDQPGVDLPQTEKTIPTASQEIVSTDVAIEENSQITKSLNAITGGEVILSTSQGDIIQLVIPPFALSENTEISLVAFSKPLDSPFKENFFPGISIKPDGLSLRLPATLMITTSTHTILPGERIFYLKRPGLAIPLWQSNSAEGSLTGKISHFSEYIGGSPRPRSGASGLRPLICSTSTGPTQTCRSRTWPVR